MSLAFDVYMYMLINEIVLIPIIFVKSVFNNSWYKMLKLEKDE
jgi:hypothetical protein